MSERAIVCEDLSLAIDDLKREGFRLDLLYPADDPQSAVLSRAGETIRLSMADAAPLVALSGPEGGLSTEELSQALAAGFEPMTLGPWVLRAETAPLALLALATLG